VDPGDLPPGLRVAAIEDPDALVDAHRRALANRSFTVHYNYVVYDGNGSIRRGVNVRAVVARNRTRFGVAVDDVVDDLGYPEAYDDERYYSAGAGAAVLAATHDDGPVEYSVVDAPGEGPNRVEGVLGRDPSHADRLGDLLVAAGSVRVEAARETTRGAYVVRATELQAQARFARRGPAAVSDVSMAFLVAEDGLVSEVYVSYATSVDGRRVRVVEQIRFLDVGTTRVYRPVWIEDALTATSAGDRPAGDGGGGRSEAPPRDRRVSAAVVRVLPSRERTIPF
jgi:hypothetical protein